LWVFYGSLVGKKKKGSGIFRSPREGTAAFGESGGGKSKKEKNLVRGPSQNRFRDKGEKKNPGKNGWKVKPKNDVVPNKHS